MDQRQDYYRRQNPNEIEMAGHHPFSGYSPQIASDSPQYRHNSATYGNESEHYVNDSAQYAHNSPQYAQSSQYAHGAAQYTHDPAQYSHDTAQYTHDTAQYANDQGRYRGHQVQYTDHPVQYNQGQYAGEYGQYPTDTKEPVYTLEPADTFQTTYEQAFEGKLFHDGEMILQPAPTRDPKDPMNLPLSRKIMGVFCLSFFGALAASAEIILGACLPVFALQYADIDYKILSVLHFPVNSDPLGLLNHLGNGVPIFKIYLLGALPLLMIGVSNLFLIPLAISVGRRPVVLLAGCIAIAGAVWAGFSTSLDSHLGARCVQAVGAGTVESLIPFIIQDITFVHQRNTWISSSFAAQGIIIIAIGFSAPYLIIIKSWRWVYFVTAMGAAVFMVGIFFFLPETRWYRTRAEMNGVPRDDSNISFEPRSYKTDVALFTGKAEWRKGLNAFWDTCRVFFYPQIFFVTMLNGAMISSAFAASYTAAPALLTQPWAWPFEHLGFCLTAVLIASILSALITGSAADLAANWVAKKRGRRIAENQLINLILPTSCGLIGSVLFGLSANDTQNYSWATFLTALGLLAFGFLGTSAIGTVYVLECYPHLAGPALVSIASFRFLIAFLLTFEASNWVVNLGYLHTFLIYTGLIGVFMLAIPIVYYWGPAWRKRWPAHRYGDQ